MMRTLSWHLTISSKICRDCGADDCSNVWANDCLCSWWPMFDSTGDLKSCDSWEESYVTEMREKRLWWRVKSENIFWEKKKKKKKDNRKERITFFDITARGISQSVVWKKLKLWERRDVSFKRCETEHKRDQINEGLLAVSCFFGDELSSEKHYHPCHVKYQQQKQQQRQSQSQSQSQRQEMQISEYKFPAKQSNWHPDCFILWDPSFVLHSRLLR